MRRPANGRPSSLAALLVNAVGRPPHDAFRGGASVHVVASVNRSDLLSAVMWSSAGKPLPRNLFGGLCSALLRMWGPNRGGAAPRVPPVAPRPATMQESQAWPYDTQY